MVLIVARQVSAAEETTGGKNCGKHPKHSNLYFYFLLFTHLADAFIQSDLQIRKGS